MADHQNNSTTDGDEGSPFTRPGFLVAAVLVLVIVLLGGFVAVRVARNGDTTASPPASTGPQSPSATEASTPTGSDVSVCGLPAGTAAGELKSAPAVTWAYQGTIAYPSSPEFGPGKTAPEGYRYCFQHSPAGAVVMAANAMAQGSDPELDDTWPEYVLGEGRYRDELAGKTGTGAGTSGTRMKIAGFKVLAYEGTTARVDLGVQVSSQNQNLTVSGVYELVWQNGDWKISADVQQPLDVSTISDLAGYTPWGE